MKIWVFDLEPLEERYTSQMREWVEANLKEREVEYEFVTPTIYRTQPLVVDGVPFTGAGKLPEEMVDTLTSTVENGTVLDAVGTNYYKAKQLAMFMDLIHNGKVERGDIVFLFDFQYPGLEAIKYTSELMDLDLKLYAVCHASSYVKGDFTEDMASWLIYFERGWWKILDGIFVGTKYHKNAILERRYSSDRESVEDKIHVTGNAFHSESVRDKANSFVNPKDREFDIVFSNRWDEEKDPDMFVTLLELLSMRGKKYKVAVTTSRKSLESGSAKTAYERLLLLSAKNIHDITIFEGISKADYYGIVANSKVFITTSPEEMFGYCLVEALALGCHPIARNCASHPEIITQFNHEEFLASQYSMFGVLPKEVIEAYDRYLYSDPQQAVDKIMRAVENPIPKPYLTREYDRSIAKMLDIMIGKHEEENEEDEPVWLG